jgi:hypothetical protein
MAKWKVDMTMAIWGIAFGVIATVSGLFILQAVEGGSAEGFFLLVLFWVLILVGAAKLVQRITEKDDDDSL